MREIRDPQISIFEFYGQHETGQQLKKISEILDATPAILDIAAKAFLTPDIKETGSKGLTVDSIVRAALLKQMMGLSYDELSFYLQDSLSYNSFARIDSFKHCSASCLQSGISKLDAAC